MSRILQTVLMTAALLAASLSAQAQTKPEQISTKVFYGDLDLSKPAGMQTLMRRLKGASLQVCGDNRGALKLGNTDQARCSEDAIAEALTAIGKSQTRRIADNSEHPAH